MYLYGFGLREGGRGKGNFVWEKGGGMTVGREDPPRLELTLDSLLQAARSAARGSAQGISGWRYEHIRFFLPGDGSGGGAGSCALLTVAQCLAAGNAPPSLLRLLASGRSFALNKDTKGDKVRPITIGDVLRRWVTKAILIEYGEKFEEHLGALQYAVRTSAGADKIF
uniref:Uncharacterized protein n=1 Tax=Chromera velia CCMP2878 TaxID=1169474 RepID=A0A0G4G9C5_9ALVE|eukprot:Cvel_4388.t1-p1 / transcript=Cvel_4388.t1 / gene=Cvel_4388 / organism=Chromera_velia_CCMP2878 / gene_product=hypothetical protein / transcript_product=hypothetical protein / location=Cvel_scaffold190:72006-74045(+) / protein_length=167 / sequence_SO=supercontig / SO=protein_coding / is_pseudo=false